MSAKREDLSTAPVLQGSYTASLLGTIRSHLEGLQGYDVMALELIQNADDAGSDGQGNTATEIVFDVTDQGLEVRNDGRFTYCGDLGAPKGPHELRDGYACDYHRIIEVASGGKLASPDNTGRFGIGFVSTYQIADHPQIHSAGVRLTLMPEQGTWTLDATTKRSGTLFFLPWATDAKSETRLQLGASAVTPENIDQLVADFQRVLRNALLFLRRLKRAELRRNGALVLSCDLDRDRQDESELLVSFDTGDTERWLILRADATEAAQGLAERFPQLATLKRKTLVSIAIRAEPEPVSDGAGLLYAFLPTEQPTGLPAHINADFFPESDRKALIFSGNQHQQAWNELLIQTAADKLADSLEMLRDKLGAVQLWSLLHCAMGVNQGRSGQYPSVFEAFWNAFRAAVDRGAAIAQTAAGRFERPRDVLIARQPLEEDRLAVMQQLGGRIVSETLRPHRNALIQCGAKELAFAHLVALMDSYFQEHPEDVEPEPEPAKRVASFYRPLWALVESLRPETTTGKAKEAIDKIKEVACIVDADRRPKSINACYRAVPPATASELSTVPPYLPFAHDLLRDFPRLNALVDPFDLVAAANELQHQLIETETPPEDLLGTDKEQLRALYKVLATLPDNTADRTTYESLGALPIWSTVKGFVAAEDALLPGDFSDPIGQTTLIKQNLLDPTVRQFLGDKLGVARQTIAEYVRVVVPRFIGESGPGDLTAYTTLVQTLANHSAILDNAEQRGILAALPMVPTKDGGWAKPAETYFRTEALVSALGEAEHRWVYVSRAGKSRAVRAFLEGLGVRRVPSAEHLAERMLQLADAGPPTEEARRASEKAFYEICDLHKASPEDRDVRAAVAALSEASCLPAHAEDDDWFSPDELHAPFRFQAFESQAQVLDFKNTQRLSSRLLADLGVATEARTQLIVDHLLHCVKAGKPAHSLVYQVLNERAREDDREIHRLRGQPCIYLDASEGYVRPNQLYLIPQSLGQYAYNAPAGLEEYKALFNALGVKDRPGLGDYVDIVLDIVQANFLRETPLDLADRQIYVNCIAAIAAAWVDGLLGTEDLERLQDAPAVPNVSGLLRRPDELLLRDSEYHAGFFGEELDDTLCQPVDPALVPFMEELGVRRLSEVAAVQLDFVGGIEEPEQTLCQTLMERSQILARMLHAQPHATRRALDKTLQSLSARSAETVRIRATVALDEEPFCAAPNDVKAFYDAAANALVLARPVTERSWVPVFSALLHQLMPDETAPHIAQLALALRPLMTMSLAEAEEWLLEAHIPYLEIEPAVEADLASQDSGGLGAKDTTDGDGAADQQSSDEQPDDEPEPTDDRDNATTGSGAGHGDSESTDGEEARRSTSSKASADQSATGRDDTREGEPGGASGRAGTERDGAPSSSTATSDGNASAGGSSAEGSSSEPKTSHGRRKRNRGSKSLWDRELISYARRKAAESGPQGDDGSSELAQHNLATEAAARAAVCAWERERGREPEEQSQTNPGFDIVSRQPGAPAIDRYIEVKGTSGAWDKRGVGLSRTQFSNAQDLGDRFWLYVVEFALEDGGARVHAIQNPALKVDHFMFDGGWRDVAAEEAADPAIGFVAGARIDCGLLGSGQVIDVHDQTIPRELTVEFDDGRRQRLRLTLQTMHIVREDEAEAN